MKQTLKIILYSILIFIFLTLATVKIETPLDGNDTLGFPLTFFTRFGGECNPCPESRIEINYLYLLADATVSFITAIVIFNMIQRVMPKKNK